jgi:protein-tyrosine phosphatase
MIDIHCHILPDLDDGATSWEEALEMARISAASGVTDIIATPHFRGEPEALEMLDEIDRRCRDLSREVEQCGIPIRIHPGAEVLCTPQTPILARQGMLPTLGNTQYVLTEFYFNESFGFMDDTLMKIADCGYIPVVAHPERYDTVQWDPERLREWADQGFVFQLNKGSILGTLGFRAEQTAHELLELGLAHVIASDGHSCERRTPNMTGLLRWAEECCDPECAHILLTENPGQILNGLPIATL